MRICENTLRKTPWNNPVPLLTGEKNKVRLPGEEVAMATSDNLLLLRSIRDCLIIAVDWCKTLRFFSIALKGLFTLSESEKWKWFFSLIFYRPQPSWGKVIFSRASVILFTGGGVCLSACWDTPLSMWRWIKDCFCFYFRSLWMDPYRFSWNMKKSGYIAPHSRHLE